MILKIQQIVLMALILLIGQNSFALLHWDRCGTISKALGANYALSVPEVDALRKWLIRCEPRMYMDLIENNYLVKSIDGEEFKVPVYPILGIQKLVDDANIDTGFRFEYSNPLNYHFDISGVTTNPDAAPCDVPSDYRILAYCNPE